MPLLSLLLTLPLVAGLIILAIPQALSRWYRVIATSVGLAQLILSVVLWQRFDKQTQGFQFIEQAEWFTLNLGDLGQVSIQYLLGLDGLSLPLVVLSAFVLTVGAFVSWSIKQFQQGYYALFMLLSSAVMGTFLALDQFLFFLCFEFMLLPMYFLVGIWGGPRRTYAAIKFFLYTLLGSVLILVVLIGFANSSIDLEQTASRYSELTGQPMTASETASLLKQRSLPVKSWVRTFDYRQMTQTNNKSQDGLLSLNSDKNLNGYDFRWLAFLALLIGFGIKLPMVPFHTWLPDAHVEAPTPVSVVLAGILLKIGAFGLYRLGYVLLPEVALSLQGLVIGLGTFSFLYGAFIALAQDDLKKMVAYSSVSHMGIVLIGLASNTEVGLQGAFFQLISHGVISAGLFIAVGVIYDQTHNRQISAFAGLLSQMPKYAVLVGLLFFASLGLPMFSGFIAELAVLMGLVEANQSTGSFWAAIPFYLLALVITAGYYLWAFKRMFMGSFQTAGIDKSLIQDASLAESFSLGLCIATSIVLGLLPGLLFDLFASL